MEQLSHVEIGPKNPSLLSDPLSICLHFKTVDPTKKFNLSFVSDVTNKRKIMSVAPLEHQMNEKGELRWDIDDGNLLVECFKGNVGMISIQSSTMNDDEWKCNLVVMVNGDERTVLSPLE